MRTTYKELYRRVDYINMQLQAHGAAHPISVRGGGKLHGVDLMEDWHFYNVKKTLTPLVSNKECLAWLEGYQEALEHLLPHLSRTTIEALIA
jgi:hypothetical protein